MRILASTLQIRIMQTPHTPGGAFLTLGLRLALTYQSAQRTPLFLKCKLAGGVYKIFCSGQPPDGGGRFSQSAIAMTLLMATTGLWQDPAGYYRVCAAPRFSNTMIQSPGLQS